MLREQTGRGAWIGGGNLPGTVIQCESTLLTPAQTNYSVTDIELLAILWALENTAFYTKGGPVIKVYSDHSALVSLCHKKMITVPNHRLINMLQRLSNFNYTVTHLPES